MKKKKKKIKPLQHFSYLEERQQEQLQNQISFFQKTKPKILKYSLATLKPNIYSGAP